MQEKKIDTSLKSKLENIKENLSKKQDIVNINDNFLDILIKNITKLSNNIKEFVEKIVSMDNYDKVDNMQISYIDNLLKNISDNIDDIIKNHFKDVSQPQNQQIPNKSQKGGNNHLLKNNNFINILNKTYKNIDDMVNKSQSIVFIIKDINNNLDNINNNIKKVDDNYTKENIEKLVDSVKNLQNLLFINRNIFDLNIDDTKTINNSMNNLDEEEGITESIFNNYNSNNNMKKSISNNNNNFEKKIDVSNISNQVKLEKLEENIKIYNDITNTDLINKIKEKLQIVLDSMKNINLKIKSEDIEKMINNFKNNNKSFILNNLNKVSQNVNELNKFFQGGNGDKEVKDNNFFLKK